MLKAEVDGGCTWLWNGCWFLTRYFYKDEYVNMKADKNELGFQKNYSAGRNEKLFRHNGGEIDRVPLCFL